MKKYGFFLLTLVLTATGLPAQDHDRPVRLPEAGEETPAVRPDATLKPLIWRVRDRVLQAGRTVDVNFLAFQFTDLAAVQFALKFDPTQLHFEQIEVLTPDLPLEADAHFGLFGVQAGEIRSVWSTASGYTLPAATAVFQIRFTALAGGKKLSEALHLEPSILTPVAYNTVLVPRGVQLVFADYLQPDPRGSAAGDSPGLRLEPNRPNPFGSCTTLGFTLPAAAPVQWRVLDASGREWFRREGACTAGFHEEIICLEDEAPAGVLYCQLITPFGTCVRKIQIVK